MMAHEESKTKEQEILNEINIKLWDNIKEIFLKDNNSKLYKTIWLELISLEHINRWYKELLRQYDPNEENDSLIATIIIYAIATQEMKEEIKPEPVNQKIEKSNQLELFN
jgi:hypothetical protein